MKAERKKNEATYEKEAVSWLHYALFNIEVGNYGLAKDSVKEALYWLEKLPDTATWTKEEIKKFSKLTEKRGD